MDKLKMQKHNRIKTTMSCEKKPITDRSMGRPQNLYGSRF